MRLSHDQLALLRALFLLARDGRRTTVHALARCAGLRSADALGTLASLRERGLAQDRALRLTLPGLVVAASSAAAGRSRALVGAA